MPLLAICIPLILASAAINRTQILAKFTESRDHVLLVSDLFNSSVLYCNEDGTVLIFTKNQRLIN